MGRSGEAAKKLLLRQGTLSEDIITFDQKPGLADEHDPAALLARKPDVLVVSPGVPLANSWIVEARAQGVRITSEIGLACDVLAGEKLIGVTGSVGKSTTVALLGEGARHADPQAFVGGNFGVPFCEYAVEVLSGIRPRAKWVVLELSSFQLENCEPLSLDFSAITSFSPNHLERYANLREYYEIKWSLLDRTRGPCFLNSRGGDLKTWALQHPGRWVLVGSENPELTRFQLASARLIGRHNQDNLALAVSVGLAAGWPTSFVERMKSFTGLPHRLENLGTARGIRFINDSKATAMDSVLTAAAAATELCSGSSHLFLLLGGKDKNLPWEQLSVLKDHPRLVPVFFGHCGELAQSRSGLDGSVHAHLLEAVRAVLKNAREGDVVLLSPGGTSLDEFRNFEERGRVFQEYLEKEAGLNPL
ncbi:MAG: UDP-N-acetylmuramoyl-L-alanine--D-glutamate ligase [Bdellovibrionaceae bacterium]|nr:UDP-N-acetylmuramoyl-L-alanine--D-glutamate ligase [Pseudobdellovibrionaceae bacterium]MBX3033697.1 UDP-N-acetylmuramoyl-L-alanine--D-glutamate ligase [Pseudobdellovibrionaceae bacterium]